METEKEKNIMANLPFYLFVGIIGTGLAALFAYLIYAIFIA
jgi:hypothetical protein